MPPFFTKRLSLALIFIYALGLPVQAANLSLPAANQFILPSSSFSLPLLKGLKFDPQNPLKIEFIIDTAHKRKVTKQEASKLIKYFLAALTIPKEDIWVNLSPYEKDRITPQDLGSTDLGKDLLSQDYILKQLSSSLTYPDSPSGKSFWDQTYKQVMAIAKTTNIPIDTFNKVWVVPEQAEVYENKDLVLISKARLKVMLEEDYLALKRNPQFVAGAGPARPSNQLHKVASQAMKQVILPKINKDINQGNNFANLRQIYHSLILGLWFKDKFKNPIYQHYINQNKIKGIDLIDKQTKEKIYQHYLSAFKSGLYDYIKTDKEPVTNKRIRRRYFSGGFDLQPGFTIASSQATAQQMFSIPHLGPYASATAKMDFGPVQPPASSAAVDELRKKLRDNPKQLWPSVSVGRKRVKVDSAMAVQLKTIDARKYTSIPDVFARIFGGGVQTIKHSTPEQLAANYDQWEKLGRAVSPIKITVSDPEGGTKTEYHLVIVDEPPASSAVGEDTEQLALEILKRGGGNYDAELTEELCRSLVDDDAAKTWQSRLNSQSAASQQLMFAELIAQQPRLAKDKDHQEVVFQLTKSIAGRLIIDQIFKARDNIFQAGSDLLNEPGFEELKQAVSYIRQNETTLTGYFLGVKDLNLRGEFQSLLDKFQAVVEKAQRHATDYTPSDNSDMNLKVVTEKINLNDALKNIARVKQLSAELMDKLESSEDLVPASSALTEEESRRIVGDVNMKVEKLLENADAGQLVIFFNQDELSMIIAGQEISKPSTRSAICVFNLEDNKIIIQVDYLESTSRYIVQLPDSAASSAIRSEEELVAYLERQPGVEVVRAEVEEGVLEIEIATSDDPELPRNVEPDIENKQDHMFRKIFSARIWKMDRENYLRIGRSQTNNLIFKRKHQYIFDNTSEQQQDFTWNYSTGRLLARLRFNYKNEDPQYWVIETIGPRASSAISDSAKGGIDMGKAVPQAAASSAGLDPVYLANLQTQITNGNFQGLSFTIVSIDPIDNLELVLRY